jgi:four helix bundle protein
MKNYKNLVVWKKAHETVVDVYKVSKYFPKEEQYGLTSQLRRAAMSVPTNIAEGCGKYTQNDFAKYLQDAQGSIQEVEYLSLLAYDLEYLRKETYEKIEKQAGEVKAMLISLIKKIRKI